MPIALVFALVLVSQGAVQDLAGFQQIRTYASATNGNGSAMAGLASNSDWYNTTLGLAMLLGRFVPIVLVLALAGPLAAARPKLPDARDAADDGAGVPRVGRVRSDRRGRSHLPSRARPRAGSRASRLSAAAAP